MENSKVVIFLKVQTGVLYATVIEPPDLQNSDYALLAVPLNFTNEGVAYLMKKVFQVFQ